MTTPLSWTWWKRRPALWLSYVVIASVSWIGFLFFRVLVWTRVEGKENFRRARRQHNHAERRNVILVSNHVTMFDSFIVGIIAYFPELLFWPSVAPYHLAATENFFRFGLARLILTRLRALPVARGRKDVEILKRLLDLLPEANVHIFPGGRRSLAPLGSDRPVRGGIGYVLANAPNPKPLVIPVYLGGVEKVFGGAPGSSDVRRWFPRLTGIFRRPLVRFGPPVQWLPILAACGNTKKGWEAIARHIAKSINDLAP